MDESIPIPAFIKNPEIHPAVQTLMAMSCLTDRRIYGQFNIEESQEPMGIICAFCHFPSGDFYLWFTAQLRFCVVLLVDEKLKTVYWEDIAKLGFYEFLHNAINQLNIKNGYPIEEPDDFVPASQHFGDNPQ